MNTPDHTVTFALGAYGQLLVQRHRLAMRLQASLEPEQAVWSNQAFVLVPVARPDPAGQEITAAQLEHPSAVPLLERAGVIKALATLLRFAYLADAAVRCVWLLASTTTHSVSAPRLQASFGDGQVVELRLAGEAYGRLVILQGGDPDAWFDAGRWTAMAPVYRMHVGATPLSEPRRFPTRCVPLLHTLGARRIGGNLWAPPPGSAIDELEGVVAERTARDPQRSLAAPFQ